MIKLSKLSILLSCSFLCCGVAHANRPTTFLGPTAEIGFTNALTNTAGYSIQGEVGAKNYRVGGTFGLHVTAEQLFKVSVDYLWQNINYSFLNANSTQWVQQGSVSADYQFALQEYGFDPLFDVNVYISHAPSKSLSGRDFTMAGLPVFEMRRLAGSNADGIAPGLSLAFWQGGRIGAELNYDSVRYDNDNNGINENAKGLGGTIRLNQQVIKNVDLGFSAAVRKPFNNYALNIAYDHFNFYGDWNLGLFADYTTGKDSLPNTWNAGITANYFLDERCSTAQPMNLKDEKSLAPVGDNLLAWVSTPAVYLPQVLTIVDGNTRAV